VVDEKVCSVFFNVLKRFGIKLVKINLQDPRSGERLARSLRNEMMHGVLTNNYGPSPVKASPKYKLSQSAQKDVSVFYKLAAPTDKPTEPTDKPTELIPRLPALPKMAKPPSHQPLLPGISKEEVPTPLKKELSPPKRGFGDAGRLNFVLHSLHGLIDEKKYYVISREFEELNKHYVQKSYTSSGLRAGRALEFMFFSLAESWSISLTKERIRELQLVVNNMINIESNIIKDLDEEKSLGSKKKLQIEKSLSRVSRKIELLKKNLDKGFSCESQKKSSPFALFKDIERAFAGDDEISRDLEHIKDNDLIKKVMDKRNIAAHADISGKFNELDKSQVDTMIRDLEEIIFRLVNIASALKPQTGEDLSGHLT